MAGSDRAFRALAHHEPHVVVDTLRCLLPDFLPLEHAAVRAEPAPTRLDALAPPRDADSVLRVGKRLLAHIECQGYRDTTFPERVFWYHLELAVAYRPRIVRTAALWLVRPPEAQRRERLRHGDVRVRVRHVLVPEVPAERLLVSPSTACFAAAADPGSRSVPWLCGEVAAGLRAGGASFYQRHMAVVGAATQGRYDAMVKAMASAGLEPVIIEDLVKFGEDRGLEQGREQGFERGLRLAVLDLCELLGVVPTDAQRTRLEAMRVDELETLRQALKQTRRWPPRVGATAGPAPGAPTTGAKRR
jgi:hypothetical protein